MQASLGQGLTFLFAFMSLLGAGFGFVLAVFERVARQMEEVATHDGLTGCWNRVTTDALLEHELQRARRSGAPVAFVLLDLDHFKQINDRHGHAAGDAVLVSVARRLRDALRETDMIVRWGGEEFLVFVPETSVDRIEEIVLRLMSALSNEPFSHQGKPIRLTASIGFTPLPLPPGNVPVTWERAIALADMALYMAKLHGRNRAYGIRRLNRCDAAALAALDHSLDDAWRNGIVDLDVLQGAPMVDPQAAGEKEPVASH
jgi:diguanylate cyclase (GGDEF)-like protein